MEAPNPYTLPTISFVGGETQQLIFHIYSKNRQPFNLTGCSARLSIVETRNKKGKPILTKDMTISINEDGTAGNILTAILEATDTVDMSEKYIYQIQIRDADGNVEVPNQGIMYITNNIDKSFIKS